MDPPLLLSFYLFYFEDPGQPGVMASTSRVGDAGMQPCCTWLSHTSDLDIGTLVTISLGAWHFRVSAGTG